MVLAKKGALYLIADTTFLKQQAENITQTLIAEFECSSWWSDGWMNSR